MYLRILLNTSIKLSNITAVSTNVELNLTFITQQKVVTPTCAEFPLTSQRQDP